MALLDYSTGENDLILQLLQLPLRYLTNKATTGLEDKEPLYSKSGGLIVSFNSDNNTSTNRFR